MTVDILLSHGYFLDEDEKELQIMKPYPTLGLLYLSAYLKRAGFGVEVFDTTFADARRAAWSACDAGTGVIGLYTNLITRRVSAGYRPGRQGARLDGGARRTGERELSRGVPRARRRRRRHRRGRADAGRAAAGARRARTAPPARSARRRPSATRTARSSKRPARAQIAGPRQPALARPRGHRSGPVCRGLAHAPRHGQRQPDHRARLPLQVQVVLARRLRLLAPPPDVPVDCADEVQQIVERYQPGPGLVRR